MAKKLLEICTGDPEGVKAAIKGGADRVELCSGLAEGGLSPSIAMIRYSSERIPTNVLIRPRSGDFIYTPDEIDVMKSDIDEAVKAGANGIVVGVLTPEGNVDVAACRKLLEGAAHLENTFHRAFDLVKDPFGALEEIISLGFSRILTSGQQNSALEGAELIAELKRRANGRIKILAGAGVSPENVTLLARLSQADEFHASARKPLNSSMAYSGSASMGSADASDGSRLATDSATVEAIRKALDQAIV